MSFTQLPHELQLHTFRYLKNDYLTLCALTLVCQSLCGCAFEVLKECSRTFDLSNGLTDEVEFVLLNLYALAVSQPRCSGTSSSLWDNIFRDAVRYNKLALNFHDNLDFRDGDPIRSRNMVKLEKMWKVVAGIDRFSTSTWRERMKGRCADTSIRVVLRTMQHLTTLELGGSTDVLHWRTKGILDHLRTLRFRSITNKKLAPVCCRLAAKPQLVSLEFFDMAIESSFLEHLKNPLSVTPLKFHQCWVSLPAIRRIFYRCQGVQAFCYSIDTSKWSGNAHWREEHNLYRLMAIVQGHTATLKHLTLLTPVTQSKAGHCTHVTCLGQFSSLETLVISYHIVTPHTMVCYDGTFPDWEREDRTTAFDILSKLGPSLNELQLHRREETSALQTLSGVVNSMAPGSSFLPKLRYVWVTLEDNPTSSILQTESQKGQLIIRKFERRGVECKIWCPHSLFDGNGSIVIPE
ncbi:hypothetical protein N0V87_002582 [Didymella glomerata]|uniref:F-box domain-containing protein n=1 Tax=Didymella glomerata TaxID=749621 RepID=A0A9W9C3H0_9PLEO|nr:hypothetical protein N0V87_002582 [Didymella glomerata]